MSNTTPRKNYSTLALAVAFIASVIGTTTPAVSAAAEPQNMNQPNAPTAELTARQQAIPVMASFMAASNMPGLHASLHEGLDAGLTISEAKEILVQLYAYAGFPRSLNALTELLKVMEARKKLGVQDDLGREPNASTPEGAELLAIGTANQTKISGGVTSGPVFDFAPVINQFLRTHLFGDIFVRDNLDWQSRELATVGALAATPGAEAQLRSHMAASMRVGLSPAQLTQLTQVLREKGPVGTADRAQAALAIAIEARPK
jgi:4-carboxymuconolactone decarboxylase